MPQHAAASKRPSLRVLAALVLFLIVGGVLFLPEHIGWGWSISSGSLAVGAFIGIEISVARLRAQHVVQKATYSPYRLGAPTVQVREYKNIQAFEADARRRIEAGWFPQGRSAIGRGNDTTGVAGELLPPPWSAIAAVPGRGRIIVTWIRPPL